MAKHTEKEIYQVFIQSLEEVKDTAKKQEEISKNLKSNLENFSNEFFKKANNIHLKLDDSQAKETAVKFEKMLKNAQKGQNLTRFSFWLIGISVLVLGINVYFFWINIQSKLDIREEYKKELIEKEQYNNEQDAEFLKKFKHWISKNPNDSKSLNNSIQKEWERK